MIARKTMQLMLAVVLLSTVLPASYAKGWEYLGEAHVDGNVDHDKIKVGKKEGRFHSLQIRVDRAPIEFRHIVVHYANGGNEEVQVRQKIRAGGVSRDIDLRGGDRAIESVEFWYEKANYGSTRPRLRLYGR